jgi:hypothetical protein
VPPALPEVVVSPLAGSETVGTFTGSEAVTTPGGPSVICGVVAGCAPTDVVELAGVLDPPLGAVVSTPGVLGRAG